MEMRRNGQTLVTVALLLVVLIGFLAVAIDVGNLYAQRRFMQNAADAAALAGARALALGEAEDLVRGEVDKYALTVNGGQVCAAQIESTAITVTVGKSFATYFAGVVGVPSLTVAASAAAEYEPAGAGTGLMPMIIHSNSFTTGQEVRIYGDEKEPYDPTDNIISQTGGEFGWLDLCGTGGGGQELRREIQTGGCECTVQVGDWLAGKEGVTGSVIDAFEQWEGQEVYVPVYDVMSEDGKTYHFSGLAVFHVERYVRQGNDKYVLGTFVDWVHDFPAGSGPDYGLHSIRLRPLGPVS